MRLGITTGHGEFELKEKLTARLRAAGHEVVDFGVHQFTPDGDCGRQPRLSAKGRNVCGIS